MVNISFDVLYKDHGAKAGISGLGDVSEKTNKKFTDMKKGIAKGAGAAGVLAGGLLAKGFSDNMDIQAGQAQLGAQLGLTQQRSGQVGKMAGKLYAANYGESMEAVNETIGSVLQNMDGMKHASAAAIEDIAKKTLNLQKITGESSAALTTAISQMIRNGLAKNADEAFDILTVGFQNGVNKSEDLLDTFNEYGTQFRKMGIDGKLATGLLSQGLKAGARDADTVADTLKEFSIRSIDMSKTSIAGFEGIGLSATKMSHIFAKGGPESTKALQLVLDKIRAIKDPVKQSAIAVDLFGTKAEDMGAALFALDPSTAVKGLGDVAGAANQMDKTLGETGQARVEMMKREFEQWTQKMAGSEGALGQITAGIVGFAGPGLAMAGQVGGIVSGLAAMNLSLVLSKAGTMAMSVASGIATAATTTWTGAQWLLNAALTANPIGLVIVAIGLLTAGIVILYKKSDTARHYIQKAFAGIVAYALDMAGSVIHAAAKAFGWMPGIGPKLKRAANEFDTFRDKVNNSLNGIQDEKVVVRLNTEASVYGTKGGHYVGSTFVKYATGGGVFGAGTATSDSIPALLSNGEHVWTSREVQGAGGHEAVKAMRSAAVSRFALGGAATGSSIAGKVEYARESIAKLGEARMQSYFKVMNQGLNGALNFAHAESGKPYLWGGVGPAGYDCSGFMSALLNVVQNKNPHQRRFSTGSFPSAGFVPGPGRFMIGSFRGNPGHMAGTINGVNVESSGGVGVHMGPSARGAMNPLFTGVWHLKGFKAGGAVGGDAPFDLLNPKGNDYQGDEIRRAALYDEGGILRPGAVGRNRSGQPERVLSGRQTRAFDQMVRVVDKGMRGEGTGPAGASAVDYVKLGDHMVKAFIRAGVSVKMDGRAVGEVIGKNAHVLGRTS